jgi:hypothetical protein
MNNKSQGALSIITWLVSTVIIIFFLAGFLYFNHTLTTKLTSINVQTNLFNFTDIANKTIVPVDNAMNSLTWISFVLIVCLAFAILLENYYIREHPVLFFVHIMIVFLGIIASIYISNYYVTLMNSNNPLASTLMTFTASDYIVILLPYWVAVIGIFGIILLVINANRDPEMRRVGI